MNSPLGKYSQIVAAIVIIGTISTYFIALLLGNDHASNALFPFAAASFGSVLTAAAVTNGWKQVVANQNKANEAIHARLDQLAAPAAALPPSVVTSDS